MSRAKRSESSSMQLDSSLGGLRVGNCVEVSTEVARHFNLKAQMSRAVLKDEYVDFTAGCYSSVGLPMFPMALHECVNLHQQLSVLFDGQLSLDLSGCPRWFSRGPSDLERIRGVPTYIPMWLFPADFFNRTHVVELFQAGSQLTGPEERFLYGPGSGVVSKEVADGTGKLIARLTGELQRMAALPAAAQ